MTDGTAPALDFSGRTVLVTGAAGALGQAIATLLNRLGANLVLADLDGAGLARIAGALPRRGATIIGVVDVTRPDQVAGAVEAGLREFGRLDHLVTAAAAPAQPPGQTLGVALADQAWRNGLAVNLDGVLNACRAVAPSLQDGGSVVFLAGEGPDQAEAVASGAVLAFARGLMQELAPRGIRVNSVLPGLIDTPGLQPAMRLQGREMLRRVALRRLGRPEELARVVAFLCSDWAGFVNGQALRVDGGA